jgi:hypothetical protein
MSFSVLFLRGKKKNLFPFLCGFHFLFYASFLFCLLDEWQSRKIRRGLGQMIVQLCQRLEPQTSNGAFSYYTYLHEARKKPYSQEKEEEKCLLFKNFL